MSTVTAVPLQPVKRGYLIWLWLGILLAAVAAVMLATQGDDFLTRNARDSGVVVFPSGLQKKVLTPATKPSAHPTSSDVALLMYEGKLLDGTTFDKSEQPTPMPLSGVVPGFSEALKTMSKGEKARFWLNPSLAYGAEAKGPIPANSTLVFDVQLLDFIPESVLRQMQMQQQMMGGAGGGPAGMPGGAAPGGGAPGGR